MIKIAICDDNGKDRNRLKEFVDSYEKEWKIKFSLQLFSSGEELLESGFLPDILFLDIVMGKKDGIQVGIEIKQRKAETFVIYITALEEKAMAAINNVHAFGYFKKPIKQEEFFQILSKSVTLIQQNRNQKEEKEEKVVFLSKAKKSIALYPMDIYYFEYDNRKITITTKDSTIICRGTIRDIADKMEEYGFAVPHQSFVVNVFYVENISNQMLVMVDGKEIPLAQKRASEFRKRLLQAANEGDSLQK